MRRAGQLRLVCNIASAVFGQGTRARVIEGRVRAMILKSARRAEIVVNDRVVDFAAVNAADVPRDGAIVQRGEPSTEAAIVCDNAIVKFTIELGAPAISCN
jgi:hypothetical protein